MDMQAQISRLQVVTQVQALKEKLNLLNGHVASILGHLTGRLVALSSKIYSKHLARFFRLISFSRQINASAMILQNMQIFPSAPISINLLG